MKTTQEDRKALRAALSGRMEMDLELLHHDPKLVYLMENQETALTASHLARMERDLKLLGDDPRLVWIMQKVRSEAARSGIDLIDRETVGALGAMAVMLGAGRPQLQRIMRPAMILLP